jgi:hypothetical protein
MSKSLPILNILGGEGGIRTHETPYEVTVFETVSLNHSDTSPYLLG